MKSPREYAHIKRYEHVSSSKRLVCTGESHGSYNYSHIDEVYPKDKPFIPVENRWGGTDYIANPNFRPEE